jgi:hypothetical protein
MIFDEINLLSYDVDAVYNKYKSYDTPQKKFSETQNLQPTKQHKNVEKNREKVADYERI